MQEWIFSVWNVHIQVMLKVISFSILNVHELVETTGLPQSKVHFPWPNELTFCPDINGSKFQSTFHALDTDDVTQKTSLFSVQGQSAWYCFMVVVLLFLRHLTPVHRIQCKCLHSHHNHPRHPLLHEFIVNVKYTMDWSNRKPYCYTCLSFNFIVK